MAKYLITVGLFFGVSKDNLFGQNLPAIQLDRPDQTECPFITPAKYIQTENGFAFEKANNYQNSFTYPAALFKYGINDKLELRLITVLVTEKNNNQSSSGFAPMTIGFKTALFEEKGFVPKTSFIGHLKTSNIGSKQFSTKYIAPSFRFTMQHTLSEKLAIAYNIGTEWDGETAAPTYIYTLTTGISVSEKIGFYAEMFGFLPKENKAEHIFDCGFTYLVNNNFMLDISGGLGLTDNAPENYLSLGISYRYKTANR